MRIATIQGSDTIMLEGVDDQIIHLADTDIDTLDAVRAMLLARLCTNCRAETTETYGTFDPRSCRGCKYNENK
jgi:hypothetical protein